jgi:hypothetical protein
MHLNDETPQDIICVGNMKLDLGMIFDRLPEFLEDKDNDCGD